MTFFIISFIVLLLAHSYIGMRIISPYTLSTGMKILYWSILSFLFLSPFLAMFSRFSGFSQSIESFLGWIGFSWLGFISIIFLLVLFRDIGWGIGTGINKTYKIVNSSINKTEIKENSVNKERRQFIIQSINLGIVGISLIGTGYGLYQARRKAAVVEVDIPLENLPDEFDGFRIVQFSDLHVGPTIKNGFVKTVVDQINDLKADMIAFTGDLVDGSVENLHSDVEPLKKLSAPFGKYFVTGNHEYYSGALAWCEEAKNLDFDVLNNENRIISKENDKVVLAGITDFSGGNHIAEHKSDPGKAIINIDQTLVKILLAHQPRSIYEASRTGYDLQISGHTHGGQIIPWHFLTRLAQPYMSGLHKHKNTWIYVNQGTGYWGPPVRVGARSEITVLHLKKVTCGGWTIKDNDA